MIARQLGHLVPPRPVRFRETVEEYDWRMRRITRAPHVKFNASDKSDSVLLQPYSPATLALIASA